MTFGFDQLNTYMSGLAGRLRQSQRDALTDAALLVEREVKSILNSGGQGLGWAPHAEATKQSARYGVRLRRAKKFDTNVTLLHDTGHMKRTVTHEVDDEIAIIGSSTIYDGVHEFGTKIAGRSRRVHIPARPHYEPAVKRALPGVKAKFIERVERAGKR
jgi:phage gpG-like protein